MVSRPEGRLLREMSWAVEKLGGEWWSVERGDRPGPPPPAGCPTLRIWLPAWRDYEAVTVDVELRALSGQPSPVQEGRTERMYEAGHPALVWRSMHDFVSWLNGVQPGRIINGGEIAPW